MWGPRGKGEGLACAGQGVAGAVEGGGWASNVHQHGWEVPKVPCGGRVARAVRVGEGLSALLTLLIWTMRSVQGSEHGIERASGAVRHAARDMGADTAREVR